MGILRYMKETGFTHQQLASVAVAQRKWSNKVPRAMMRDLITVEDVFACRMIATRCTSSSAAWSPMPAAPSS